MPSTVIRTYHYNAEQATLRIVFVSGEVYDYENVPETVYLAMKKSLSKGIFFNKEIKDKYTFKHLNR